MDFINKTMWQGKVVIITGSSMGIGKMLAMEIGKMGGRIIINGRNANRLNNTFQDLKRMGIELSACKGDISNVKDCRKIINHAVDKYGIIDILINNAGIASKASLEEVGIDVFKKVVDVNFVGAVCMTKFALPYIKKTDGGIFYVGSIAGIHGLGDHAAYCCSKIALKTLVESLRIELHATNVYVGFANVGFTENDPEKTFLDKNGQQVSVQSREAFKKESSKKVALKVMQMIEKRNVKSTFTFLGKLNEFVYRFSPFLVYRFLLRTYLKEQY